MDKDNTILKDKDLENVTGGVGAGISKESISNSDSILGSDVAGRSTLNSSKSSINQNSFFARIFSIFGFGNNNNVRSNVGKEVGSISDNNNDNWIK